MLNFINMLKSVDDLAKKHLIYYYCTSKPSFLSILFRVDFAKGIKLQQYHCLQYFENKRWLPWLQKNIERYVNIIIIFHSNILELALDWFFFQAIYHYDPTMNQMTIYIFYCVTCIIFKEHPLTKPSCEMHRSIQQFRVVDNWTNWELFYIAKHKNVLYWLGWNLLEKNTETESKITTICWHDTF